MQDQEENGTATGKTESSAEPPVRAASDATAATESKNTEAEEFAPTDNTDEALPRETAADLLSECSPNEADEDTTAERARFDALQKKANRIAVYGRWACVLLFLVFCISMGTGLLAFKVASGVVLGAAVVAEIVTVAAFSRKIKTERERLEPEIAIGETAMFLALAEEFTFDEMKAWTDTVSYKSIRAFRDDITLEVEFTMHDGTVLSVIFDNDRVRLIVNDHEASAYELKYNVCEDKTDVYDALSEQIRGIMD